MGTPVLHYIYDPLCGWCYAAAPLVEAARAANVDLTLHGGGLFPEPVRFGADKAAYIRSADARIADLTGQRFGTGYLDKLLGDPATVFWSRPPIAAVLAAEEIKTGTGADMLAGIQRAHYVDGRRVVERETLHVIAAEIGLDIGAFDLAFRPEAVGAHIVATRELMSRVGIRGFPGFVVEVDGRFDRLPHEGFYGRPAEFVAAVTGAVRRGAA